MTSRPDVLFVAHRVPYPPEKADRSRMYYLLRLLAPYARVHLAVLTNERVSADAEELLGGLCARVAFVPGGRLYSLNGLRWFVQGRAATEGAFRSRKLTATVRAWASDTGFTSAIASAAGVAHYLKTPGLERTWRVVDLVDLEGQKWGDCGRMAGLPRSWLCALEGLQVRQLERGICRWADAVTLASEADAVMLAEATGTSNIGAVMNGVDLDFYWPTPGVAESGCVFVGDLDTFPDVDGIGWFARTIWPNVRQRHPEARLSVVGNRPVRAVLELRAIPGIDVIGPVPDVRPYLAQAAVVVAPLRVARGLPSRVLQAMAAARPVVATPAALAGFGSAANLPACPANGAGEWISVLTSLLGDDAERHQLGQAGRVYARMHHNWAQCLAPFRDILGLRQAEAVSGRAL